MSDVRLPPGTSVCGCASCGEIFSGIWAFDEHWKGVSLRSDGNCLKAADVGLVVKRRTKWGAAVWGWPLKEGAEVPWNARAGGAVGVERPGVVGGGG